MDENTVFQNSAPPQGEPQPNPSSPSSQPQPVPVAPIGAAVPPAPPPPPAGAPMEEIRHFPFELGTLLKAGIGLLIVVLIAFLIIWVVLPRLTGSKNNNVELTYWGLFEEENTVKAVLSDFERQNPNIKVNYKKQDLKQYRERLSTQIGNGGGPDVFRYHNSWYPMFAGSLIPLPSDVISVDTFKKTYFPVASSDLIKNGALYGIPLGIDSLSLFVNTEALRSIGVDAPKTWDEFISTSKKLTVKNEAGEIKNAGAALGTFDNVTHASDIVSLLMVQNGADLRNLSVNPSSASDALSFYVSFAKDAQNVWNENMDPSIMVFARGNLSMYFGYSWDVFTIKAINPDLDFQVVEVPHLLNRDVTISSYWVEGVSNKSKHQKEALLLMKFLAKKETAEKLYSLTSKTRLFGQPYARVDLAESLKSNPLISPFVSQAKNSVSTFFASDTMDNGLNTQMNGYLGNAVRSVLGNTSPQSAVETLSAGVSQVLKQYGQ